MKNIHLVIMLLTGSITGLRAQDAYTSFRLSDSLYRASAFKEAAMANMAGIRADKVKDNPVRYLYAAGAFARANMPDSAFAALNAMMNSKKISPAAVRSLSANKDFQSLQSDARWNPLLEKLTRKAAGNYNIEEWVYGHKEGLALSMLKLAPSGKPNGKAIIRVVAGSWYSSYASAESYVMSSYEYLASGFTVFHVMVGSNPRFNIPEQIADVKRAVRFVRYHAKKFGIDGNLLGIEGGSAGGHLSLAAGLADDKIDEKAADPVDRVSSRVQCIAVLYPPTDFLNWGGKGMNMVNARPLLELNKVWGALDFRNLNNTSMVYQPVTDTAERNQIGMAISPVYLVSADDPPVFIIHGDSDKTVPIQQSYIMVEKLKEAGIPHRFVVKPGADHNANQMLPEWNEAVAWFSTHLKKQE